MKFFLLAMLTAMASVCFCATPAPAEAPRIVNFINFVRAVEPRSEQITREVLRQTVEQQIEQLAAHNLPGTFLLQYDALIDPAYQQLFREKLGATSEVGGWWEITQPHVEAAGIAWRGRYPWDWHADVGFATGYTPQERERLTDVYMAKFKEVFGRYPASVGSWFIDAHTLAYMHDKYGITASCNCKDQYGTDGYTLWGGYWNQAYYPSRSNGYMPAQRRENQIDVPVFRMLGSDPLYQYDMGLGTVVQGVATLEPVYPDAGGSRQWTEWFFEQMFDQPCLAFNYVQAGQENSFTWDAMKQGLAFQVPMLDSLQQAGKIRIETLGQSGAWFRETYPLTPATAVTALSDFRGSRKTVWYNSRFYRANLLWESGRFRFRDIHFFNERIESDYLRTAGTSNQCVYTTLPLVDGFLWSTPDVIAGLRVMVRDSGGKFTELSLGSPTVEELDASTLRVGTSGGGLHFLIAFGEKGFTMTCIDKRVHWLLELQTAPGKELPFKEIEPKELKAEERGFKYTVRCVQGSFSKTGLAERPLQIIPMKGRITLSCNTTR